MKNNRSSAMFRLLSYTLSQTSPVWPRNPFAAQIEARSAIAKGDTANTTVLHLFSHSGTHLDAPKHFNDQGASAYQLPIENFIFFAPVVLDMPKQDNGAITYADLLPFADRLASADLALLYTHWSDQREANPQRYVSRGPFLHPDGARFLLESYPRLKGVAIDAVSIGAPDFPDETIATHRILTGVGRTDGRFMLIFEDLRIDPDLDRARRIYAWPLFIEGSDGSPCTIVAEFAE
jgi:kynurenine formamidase